jgi:hypothetical protein
MDGSSSKLLMDGRGDRSLAWWRDSQLPIFNSSNRLLRVGSASTMPSSVSPGGIGRGPDTCVVIASILGFGICGIEFE